MKKRFLGKTKNGCAVYVDLETSHAVTHFADHPKLLGFLKRAIPTIDATTDKVRLEKDMGEDVGTTDVVETNEQDEIVYALRPLRTRYSRFVKHKTPTPTSWITIDLYKAGENEYALYTAFVGRLTPSFPGGDYLPDQSISFWSNHALVWGFQEIVPGTETPQCPW